MTVDRSKLRFVGLVYLPADPTVTMVNLLLVLGVTRETLRNWRDQRSFPNGQKDGRKRWFVTADIADWLTANNISFVRK